MRIILYLGLWLVFFRVLAQQPDSSIRFTEIARIPMQGRLLEADVMGNVYVLTTSNQLYKVDKDGKIRSTLNYRFEGNIAGIDPANPLEIYVFYRELNKVVYLDNNLAYRGETRLGDFGVSSAAAIARAYDNSLWVFDFSELQLIKMDKEGKKSQSSGNVLQYTGKKTFALQQLRDDGRMVWLNDTLNGFLVFDLFGNYIRTLPITGCRFMRPLGSYVYYVKNNRLYRINRHTGMETELTTPPLKTWLDMDISTDRLYLLDQDALVIYAY